MDGHKQEQNYSDLGRYELNNNEVLIIRRAALGDEQGLIDHMKTVDCETKFLARGPGEFSLTLEQEREFIKNSLNDNRRILLVGEINGEIIANCSTGLVSNNLRFKHRASMGLAIQKKHWRKGIGKILMNECIKWCEDNNLEQLELGVVSENEAALSLYKNLGFEICGTKKHSLKYSDGSYADEYFMIKFI